MEDNFKNSKAGHKKRRPKPHASSSSSNPQATDLLKPNTNRRDFGANWNKVTKNNTSLPEHEFKNTSPDDSKHNQTKHEQQQQKRKKVPQYNKYIAIDCEMVGVGVGGHDDMLARVSIVNRNGKVLMDKYVKPRDAITDYRTAVSGIRPSDLVNAEEFDVVQEEVVQLLQNRILVGHNVRKDLQVLFIKHPYMKIRDTSNYRPLRRLVSNGRTPSLKRLSEAILGIEIQTGEHNSVEDARAAMGIYNRLASEWEQYLRDNVYRYKR